MMVDAAGQLDIGMLPTPEAQQLIEDAQAMGFKVVAEDASEDGYLPFDRTTGSAWLIEDPDEASAVARAMLAAGVPVESTEK